VGGAVGLGWVRWVGQGLVGAGERACLGRKGTQFGAKLESPSQYMMNKRDKNGEK